jgi:hypothetical protein
VRRLRAEAIKAYTLGRDLSGRAGNVDCYLWCALGLSDSVFLLGQGDEARQVLQAIESYFSGSTQKYPLESLHLRLSLLAVRHANGEPVASDLEETLANYHRLDVTWPDAYVKKLLAGDYSHPKKF